METLIMMRLNVSRAGALFLGALFLLMSACADVGPTGNLANPGSDPNAPADPNAPGNTDPNAPGNTDPNAPETPGSATPQDEPFCHPSNPEICDDGFDNNCDGNVDEGCTCTEAEKSCYAGHPAELTHPNTACRAGTQSCQREFYGDCVGQILPSVEVCDGQDNDCNGQVDEGLGCNNSPPVAICPSDQSGPPLANYTFLGAYEDPEGDPMASATWTVIDNPLGSSSDPSPASGLTTELFADVQGVYILQLEVTDTNGGVGRCTTNLTTTTQDNLRIEVSWNIGVQNDRSDVDTHLLRGSNGQWFDDASDGDDCFFRNCRICDIFDSNSTAQELACRELIAGFNENNIPIPGRVTWNPPFPDEDDPRLDLDDVEGNGPENVNIKNPRPGTYRLGIHYWDDDGFGDSTVSVRIFCGGEMVREFEPLVLRPTGNFGDGGTEFWEVADIEWNGSNCQVRELGSQGCRQICTRDQAEAGGCPVGSSRGRSCN